MEDIRYQPPLRAIEPSFLLMVLFGILLWAYHSLLYQSVYMSPILPFSFLILSPQDGILVCGRKKAILDSYTSDSLWLRMWWHKIGIRGFVSPFFFLPLFLFWMRLLTPSYLSSLLCSLKYMVSRYLWHFLTFNRALQDSTFSMYSTTFNFCKSCFNFSMTSFFGAWLLKKYCCF